MACREMSIDRVPVPIQQRNRAVGENPVEAFRRRSQRVLIDIEFPWTAVLLFVVDQVCNVPVCRVRLDKAVVVRARFRFPVTGVEL